MEDQVQLQRKTIRLVLEQCQKTLELLKSADEIEDQSTGGNAGDGFESPPPEDPEADELHELLKSKVQSKDFLEKLGSIHMSASQNISLEDRASWDIVSSQDLWEDNNMDGDPDGYVHVSKEDIVEAIACFMAAYLSSLKETKDLTPNQLQEALSKTFSAKGRKGKLRKAWDGSIVIYNVASWSATAIGMYHNPAIFKAAAGAFWSSCRVISKLF
ncbi:uncharacterized protein LOC109834005 [Asparagus officinalis]|uniref:uncharacterized protein LOC109834005 n=1 Tax=Asparagus officinalis TaxID=4686 RepID=UPI00098E8242|nr:uncharacterized protein LOC109834005 [Asparagus officinalis]